MNFHRAILACFLTALALACSSVRGAVGLNCDLSDCGIGRDAPRQVHAEGAKSSAPTEHEVRDRIEDLKGFIQRTLCFDNRECGDDEREHGYQAPHCGFLTDDRNCVGVLINCPKLCGATGPPGTHDSNASAVALVDGPPGIAADNPVSPSNSGLSFVVDSGTPTIPAEANTAPQPGSEQPKITESESNNDASDAVQNAPPKPIVDFTALDAATDSSDFSSESAPATAVFDQAPPGPYMAKTDLPAPFAASATTASFGPVAFDEVAGGQSANPEPASIVIWGVMGVFSLCIFACRRRHDA
jgi:hypothetical protein